MKIILKGRRQGITTFLVDWVKEDSDSRAIIVHNRQTAINIRKHFNLSKIDVLPYTDIEKLNGTNKKYLSFDEYQLFYNIKDKDIPENTVYVSITLE